MKKSSIGHFLPRFSVKGKEEDLDIFRAEMTERHGLQILQIAPSGYIAELSVQDALEFAHWILENFEE